MVISNAYGQIQTPVESNNDYTAVAAALGGTITGVQSAMLQGGFGAINCNTSDAMVMPAPAGVYATVALMQKNQPL